LLVISEKNKKDNTMMPQTKIKLSLGLLLFLSGTLVAQEKNSDATVTTLLGKLSVRSTDAKNEWKQLKVNDKVKNGDTLMTGNGSIATISYRESEFKLAQNSTIVVNSLYSKDKDGSVDVKQGLAWFKLVNLGGKKFNSITPTSNAGVRGTAFATVYDEKTKADLTCVCEGKVEVASLATGGKPSLVVKGNGVSVKSGDSNILPISYKGEMAKGESFPGFEKKVKAYPILKNCLSCHTPNGWKADGFARDEEYGK
jgi:hypothetical protein